MLEVSLAVLWTWRQGGPRSGCRGRPRSSCRSSCRWRCRRCCRRSSRGRRCRRSRTVAHRAIKDFHRCDDDQICVVATCFPYVIGAISVSCEVAPGNRKGRTHRPRTTDWIEDLHLISRSVKIPTQHIHLATEVHRTGVARGIRYVRERADGVSYRIIDKCVLRISQNAAGDISPTTRVDEAPDSRGRQIAKRNWQHRTLLHPARWTRRKLPNLVGPYPIRNVEPTHSDERVVKHGKAARQNASISRRIVTGNRGDHVSNRIIAEHTTGLSLGGKIRTARAVDIIRSAVFQHPASHVVGKGIGVSG